MTDTAPEAAPQQAAKPAEPNYYDQLVRLKAEFENYRKRVDREKPEFYRLGKAELLLRLLPLYDVLLAAHKEVLASHSDAPLAKGMELIFKEFEKLFKEEGVTVMEDGIGKPYDAARHEVLGTVEREDLEDGAVAEVLQAGFTMQDKILRTAKVRICRRKT